MRPWRCILVASLLLPNSLANGSAVSVGPLGINSSGLGLTGAIVGIGQVEGERSSDNTFDSSSTYINSNIDPTEVYYVTTGIFGGTIATANEASEMVGGAGHATQVAGVMISSGTATAGVSPEAGLFPAGYSGDQDTATVAGQLIATRNSGEIHAINMSFGFPVGSSDRPDGTSLLSSFVDWFRVPATTIVNSLIINTARIGGITQPMWAFFLAEISLQSLVFL